MGLLRQQSVGLTGGRLHDCPSTPNCVCSQASDTWHSIAPLRFTGNWPAAREKLLQAIASLPRSRVVAEEDTYLRIECTSLIWRFVDDLEFLADLSTNTIHVRSASRVGRSDLGVNRRRVETIRQRFAGQ